MNSTDTVFGRYASIKKYFESEECSKNPKANIFNCSRRVSIGTVQDRLLNNDLVKDIAGYLKFKDFISFSSVNVNNYMALRLDDHLMGEILSKEFEKWRCTQQLILSCRHNLNFGKNLVGYDQFIAEGTCTKSKMSKCCLMSLERYIENPDQAFDILHNSTFRHIVIFLEAGEKSPRFEIACADFGYSSDELEAFRREGKRPVDLAREVVQR